MAIKKKLVSLLLTATMLGSVVVGCAKPAEEEKEAGDKGEQL